MNDRQKKKLYKQTLIKVRKLHPRKGDVILFQFDADKIDVCTVSEYVKACKNSGIIGEATLGMVPMDVLKMDKEIAQIYIDVLQDAVNKMGE